MHFRTTRNHISAHAAVAARVLAAVIVFALAIGAADHSDEPIAGAPPGYTLPDIDTPAIVADVASDDPFAVAPAEMDIDKPDEAIWENGEIIALPRDPDKRRAARAQAAANSAARKTQQPHATYYPVETAATEPIFRQKWDEPFPQRAAMREPTAWDHENTNINLPDDFELPAEVLKRITEESGRIDRAESKEMAGVIAQALVQSFDGIAQTTLTPPDCDIAASGTHVVVVVNSDYAVYDYCGTQLASGDLGNLTNFNEFLFDPKVLYDEDDDRWLILFGAKDTPNQLSWMRLVISTGTTPPGLGGYYWYDYPWTNNGGWWGDYPDLGYDPDAVYITTNDFDWSTPNAFFQRARIAALDKLEIYAVATSFRDEFYAMTNPGDGTLAFAIRAAEMKSDPGEYYLVNSKPGGGSFLSWFELLGTPTTSWTLNSYNIACGLYDNAPNMLQGDGTYAATGGARLLTAKYYVSRLWTTHTQAADFVGGAGVEAAIEVYIIDTVARTIAQETGAFGGGADQFYCYPAVDFDPLDRGTVSFLRGGVAVFPEARYVDLTEGGVFTGSSLLVAGTDWKFDTANAGTAANPYRLGDYNGCDLARDGDNRTLWFYGHRAIAPSGAWATRVGAVNYDGAGVLSATPTVAQTNTGLVGGPFTPAGHTYTLTNTGGARIPWSLTGVNSWNTPTATSGFLNPGGVAFVSVNLNGTANGFGVGSFFDSYTFSECMSGASLVRSSTLTIGIDGSCPGAVVDLIPPDGGAPSNATGAPNENAERGFYCTALQDFDVCAIAMRGEFALPQVLTASIYAASGTSRGALLASGALTVVQPGQILHYIPINFKLLACEEYDIGVQFAGLGTTGFPYWSESLIAEPYDVDGVIRVRDGENNGGAGNSVIGHFSLIGEASNSPLVTQLTPDQTPPNSSTNSVQQRGVYVTAERTFHMNSFGWYADIPGQTLTASLYAAAGTVRGALLASGTSVVPSSGFNWHDVPLNYVLEEGEEYDLAITFGATNSWNWWTDFSFIPFTKGDVRIRKAEIGGNPGNSALMHFRVNSGPYAAGFPTDLRKTADVFPPPLSAGGFSNSAYGMYVESLINQEAYSLGWYADVPAGQALTARVYSATGTTRGTLISEGTIVSSSGGMRFHDIPLAASLVTGADYDLEIAFNTVTQWLYWSDTSGLPYAVGGQFRVVDGEHLALASNTALIAMRVNTCNVTATGIDDDPTSPPRFALGRPYPNPASANAKLPFSLDEAGRVSMTVYNVKGQRVAEILNETRPIGASEALFDTSHLAAGVYFVKMTANAKTVTRKITVVR